MIKRQLTIFGGVEMDNKRKKMIAPIVVTVIIVLYYAIYFGFLITLSPQKVKNIVTFLPMAAAPFAITNEASALSRSSLNTTMVFPSAPWP
jgi:hypothetical protein